MKLAFSTLGCPDWDLNMVISKAAEFGFDGIELRGILKELDIARLPEFSTGAKETLAQFEDAGLEIACFSSSVMMSNSGSAIKTESLDEIKRYADLCDSFNTNCIRIFGGKIGGMSWEEAIADAANNLEKMTGIIKNSNIKIVVETHDDWMKGENFRKLMKIVNSEKVGILWDVNHPFMFIREKPEKSWQEMGDWVHHTHWKDSYVDENSEHGFLPCLMGDGILPHQEIFDVLKAGGYSGYLSLEWEKRWHPDIPGPEIAFPHYLKYMKDLMAQ